MTILDSNMHQQSIETASQLLQDATSLHVSGSYILVAASKQMQRGIHQIDCMRTGLPVSARHHGMLSDGCKNVNNTLRARTVHSKYMSIRSMSKTGHLVRLTVHS